jgi:hypothetical protein
MRPQQPIISAILLLVSFLTVLAQNVIPRPNYDRVNNKYIKITIDSRSSLDTLICLLSKDRGIHINNDRFYPGYTPLIFSIAYHKTKAIAPLLSLAETTKDLAVRYNIMLALNLIGINSTITGHYTENFVNKQSRKALLSMLKYQDIKNNVLHTLLKDPWQSDVPALFLAMKNDTSNSYSIQCALIRYLIKDFPIRQKIPSWADSVTLTAPYLIRSHQVQLDAVCKIMLSDIVMLHLPNLQVENHIRRKTWHIFSTPQDCKYHNGMITTSLTAYINNVSGLDYSSTVTNEFQYYVAGNKLFFCSSETTKKILLNWWDSIPESIKMSFRNDQAKRNSPFLLNETIRD